APNDENPTYGTARVVCALAALMRELRTDSPDNFKSQIFNSKFSISPFTRADANRSTPSGVRASADTSIATAKRLCDKALDWLAQNQNPDGGWGGAPGVESSVEETALAVEALASAYQTNDPRSAAVPGRSSNVKALASPGQTNEPAFSSSLARGTAWLVDRVESGQWKQPAPIGFYFARLWYYERLYPLIFTVGALRAAQAGQP